MTRTRCLSWLLLALFASAVTPALADSFLVFTEAGIPYGSDVWTWCDLGQPCPVEVFQNCNSPEGSHFMRSSANVWAGLGVFLNLDYSTNPPTPQPEDLSAFADGEVRFHVRTPDAGIGAFGVKVEFQCRVEGATQTYTRQIADHGWDGTATWQEIAIPLTSFFDPEPVDQQCLASVISPFMITIENLPSFNSFFFDNVRWHLPNSHAGASVVEVQGRQLMVNGEPFVVNGAAYSPISICEDWGGAMRDRPDRYLVDFPLMAASGINVVRIYSSFLTTAMLDAAWSEGLYVIPTFQVDLVQNQCAAGKDFMLDRLGEMVEDLKDHPAILLWMVGSELNTDLTNLELCNDWYPQLDALAQKAHTTEGAPFHPVATANADSTGLVDVCQSGCSDDTTLPNLDIWAVHLYRGCSFGSAFTEYGQKSDCARPLIVGEFGADAWDSLLGAENEAMQSSCLETLLDEADQALAVRDPGGVSSGQIVFEWADEWWKAVPTADGDCTEATDWCNHDNCRNWENLAYPDPAINEEWWGITSLDATDPDARGLRAAHDPVSAAWNLGNVCDLDVASHEPGSDDIGIIFDPAPGSTDHTLYYGPLNAVDTYGYSGVVSGLGADGSSSLTLPTGSLFWVVVGRNNAAEGGYGTGVDERPPSPGATVPQDPDRTGLCSTE